jgi:hypothetical protein
MEVVVTRVCLDCHGVTGDAQKRCNDTHPQYPRSNNSVICVDSVANRVVQPLELINQY